MTKREIITFQRMLLDFHKKQGRVGLPWRKNQTLYRVLVSEIMLQQTQVERVVPKYLEWMKMYPSASELASASLADVLLLWNGLGYPRRAKALIECAKILTTDRRYKEKIVERNDLIELPGVGVYTSGAICAFVYNNPEVFIETNIRKVFTHFFASENVLLNDNDILCLVDATLYHENPRLWYEALMDYGSYLKQTKPKKQKSSGARKQKPYKGSMRELRGNILRVFLQEPSRARTEKSLKSAISDTRLKQALDGLVDENFLAVEKGGKYLLRR